MTDNATTTVFTDAEGQAVRLPDEFHFTDTKVNIRREGRRVIIEPIQPSLDVDAWLAEIARLGPMTDFPEREQPEMPEDRPLFD
jgi:antitoxin VapB